MALTLYHNPRCSKSRQTLALLQEQGHDPEVVEYLKNPPSKADVKRILKLLGLSPRDLMRRKEAPYKDLKLDVSTLSDDALIAAMADNPILIERPILVVDSSKAAIGRPPEAVLNIL